MKRKPDDGPAQKFSCGLLRIPSEQLGAHPSNRGGLGVLPYRVHEVGCDIMTNGLKLSRDDHVTSVEEEASEVDEAARSAEARTKTAGEEMAVSREVRRHKEVGGALPSTPAQAVQLPCHCCHHPIQGLLQFDRAQLCRACRTWHHGHCMAKRPDQSTQTLCWRRFELRLSAVTTVTQTQEAHSQQNTEAP